MFPNDVMMKPRDVERHPGGDDRGAGCTRLAGVNSAERMRQTPNHRWQRQSPISDIRATTCTSRQKRCQIMSKPLNIGMLGCGFMGRAHSNAWLQVNHFFPREHQPVLKACYGREEDTDKLEDFAGQVGLRVDRDRLAEDRRARRHRPGRRLRAQLHAPRRA